MVKSRRAQHAEDTRTALVEAARDLFAEHGYTDTSIDDIASRARVTKGAVYHHFANKRDLFEAVVRHLYASLTAQLTESLTRDLGEGGDLWDLVRAGYQRRLELVADDRAFHRIVDRDAIAVLGHTTVAAIAQADLRPVLEHAMEEGAIRQLPVGPLANLIGALISAANREIATASDPLAARREVGATLDAFLEGLQPLPR